MRDQEQEGQYMLRVADAAVDRVHEKDHDYYIFEVEATYKGKGFWPLKPSSFQLLSDRGYKYSTAPTQAVRRVFPAVDLRSGESARGQIAFKLPKGEKPVKLIYEDTWRAVLHHHKLDHGRALRAGRDRAGFACKGGGSEDGRRQAPAQGA